MKHHSAHGFSLIELLIVIVIVSILTAAATMSYQNSVRKARRGDAKASLMELAQLMERNYTESNRYDQDAAGNAYALPFIVSPRDGPTAYYNLTVATASQTFTLSATPTGPQTKDTLCMTLTLSNTGVKGSSVAGAAAECWSR